MTGPRTDTTTLPPNNPAPSIPPIDPSGNVDTTSSSENTQQLFLAALREKDQENIRLKGLLEQRNAPTNIPEADQWANFTDAPRTLIAEEVDRAVAPLNQFIQKLQRDGEFDKFKRLFRANPMYAKILDHAEQYVDQLLANVQQPSVQAVELALTSVAGAIATGQLNIPGFNFGTTPPNPAPNNPNPPVTPRTQIPPYVPPSSTPLPDNTNAQPGKRELTETERRLARSFNMSDEDYLAGLQGDAVQVKKPEAKK